MGRVRSAADHTAISRCADRTRTGSVSTLGRRSGRCRDHPPAARVSANPGSAFLGALTRRECAGRTSSRRIHGQARAAAGTRSTLIFRSITMVATIKPDYDVIGVGAGFAGLALIHYAREAG